MSENTCKWSSERTSFPSNPSNIDLEGLEAIDEEKLTSLNKRRFKFHWITRIYAFSEGQFQSPKIKPGKAGPSWVAWVLSHHMVLRLLEVACCWRSVGGHTESLSGMLMWETKDKKTQNSKLWITRLSLNHTYWEDRDCFHRHIRVKTRKHFINWTPEDIDSELQRS